MPNFDGTGPTGQGPTGKKQGPCNTEQSEQNFQRGFGGGRGGRGCCGRNRFFGNPTPAISLEEEEKALKNRLEAIQKAKEAS